MKYSNSLIFRLNCSDRVMDPFCIENRLCSFFREATSRPNQILVLLGERCHLSSLMKIHSEYRVMHWHVVHFRQPFCSGLSRVSGANEASWKNIHKKENSNP